MRIARRVLFAQAFGDFAAYEIRLKIDEAVHDHGYAVRLYARAANQALYLLRKILPEEFALPLQTAFRLLQFLRWTSPRPINIVVSDRDENQIGKTLHRQ